MLSGYVYHDLLYGASLEDALAAAFARGGIDPARRGGLARQIRALLRSGVSITSALNADDISRPLSDALGGLSQPGPDVAVRVRFKNDVTGYWVSQVVEASWDMTMAQVIDLAYRALLSYESGGEGVNKETWQVVGPTFLPTPNRS